MKGEFRSAVITALIVDLCIGLLIWQVILDISKSTRQLNIKIDEPLDIVMIILTIAVVCVIVLINIMGVIGYKGLKTYKK